MKINKLNLNQIHNTRIRKVRIIFASLILILVFSGSCSKEDVDPKHPCDTIEVTYAGVVQPILEQNCYGCQGNGSTNGGVDLGSYDAVLVPANDGRLSGAINHEPGFSPMPSRNPKLDSCGIYFIDKWIDEGAPNN
jgi:hypothetical protein